jgi:hypothetical protein
MKKDVAGNELQIGDAIIVTQSGGNKLYFGTITKMTRYKLFFKYRDYELESSVIGENEELFQKVLKLS